MLYIAAFTRYGDFMTNAYKVSILYYLLFSLLLISSAYMLFENKIGFAFGDIVNYYVGNEEKFIAAKSYGGVLKIVLPHIFVFGLFAMVLLHFLVFTELRYKKSFLALIYAAFTTALLEIFTPFFIIGGFSFFAYIKIFTFFAFLAFLLIILWLIFRSIVFK